MTILDPTLTSSGVNVATSNTPVTYTFQWTQDAGTGPACGDGDQVQITFLGNVSPSITPPGVAVCPVSVDMPNTWQVDLNTTTVDLSAFASVQTNTVWSLEAGPSTATFTPSTPPVGTGMSMVEVNTAGSYTFKLTTTVTRTSDGSEICSGEGTIVIVFTDFNNVSAGQDTTLCFIDTQMYDLQGSPASGTSMWTVIEASDGATTGDLTFADDTNPNTTATAARDGRYVLRWAVNIGDAGGCEIGDTVEVIFSPEYMGVTANATTPNCSLTASLVGSSFPASNIGQWALVSGPPGVTANDISFSADTSDITDVTVPMKGEYQFAWSVGTGSCARTSTPATVIFPEPIPSLQPVADTVIIFFGQGLEAGADMLDVRYLNPNRFIPTDTIPDVSYLWTPATNLSDPTIRNPIVNPPETTQYSVTITSNIGVCDTVLVTTVFVVLNIPIPNVFTPNSDGVNDTWDIPLLQTFPNAVLTVYNRWGNIVYDGTGYSEAWDGTNLSGDLMIDGTYFYIIKLNPNQTVRVSTNGNGQIIQEGVLNQISGYVEIIR